MSSKQPPVIVEAEQRLSRSALFQLQRRYFDSAGVSAWSAATVPHYVTCNPALAHAYAEVFAGFLRDCRASLDPSEPVTIVELGAGSGRFAYLFLRALTGLLRRSRLAVKVRYVMTDFTETNMHFWRAHGSLAPFVEQGVLDFALFDAEEDREIRLVEAGVTLAPGSLQNPLGVIGNYVFDGIRQDAFTFEAGQLHERLVSISGPDPATSGAAPDFLAFDIAYSSRLAPLDYYGDPELDAILRGYAARLDGATILFPYAAMRCVGRLAELAGGRMLLLSGDRGQSDEDALAQPEGLGMAIHGSFSLDVNHHAIAAYVTRRGGRPLRTARPHAHLDVSAFLLGEHPSGYAETQLAYEEAIERAEDVFSLRKGIQGEYERLALEPLLALIRLSRFDPRILRDSLPALWTHHEAAPEPLRRELVRTALRAWETYYPIGEEQDFAFELGLLLHAYGGYREAIALFRESALLHPDDARARWNQGLCHYTLGEVDAALACFAEAVRVAPGFVPARAMQTNG